MARTSKRNGTEPAISLDGVTDAEIKTVKDQVKAKTAVHGKKGTGRKDGVKKPASDHAPATDVLGTITGLELLQLPAIVQLGNELEPTCEASPVSLAKGRLTNTQMAGVEILSDVIVRRTIAQCADELNISHQAVYKWFNDPVFTAALELRKRENFINVGKIKMYDVYLKEVDKAVPSSRMTEQIAKTLGFFSDSDNINIEVNVDATGEQNNLEVGRDGSY